MSDLRIQQMEIGDKFVTPPIMVTKTDIDNFCAISNMRFPLFLSDQYAVNDEEINQLVKLKGAIVPGQLSFAIFMGNLVNSRLLDDVVFQLGTDGLKWPAPAYPFDELRTEIEIKNKKPTKAGTVIVEFDWWLKNQDNVVVCQGHNT